VESVERAAGVVTFRIAPPPLGPGRRSMCEWGRGHECPWSTDGPMPTVLAFHAHPDDEVFLTGGALARAAAEGHRVLVVV
jgi:hypothetical protein